MGSNGNSANGKGGGFRAKMDYYLNSGDKKHVFAGLVIITVAFGVPWYYMTRGLILILFLSEISLSYELTHMMMSMQFRPLQSEI